MKCPYCGYDKIQPNFNFCPSCKSPLNETAKAMNAPQTMQSTPNAQEKTFLSRIAWTYEKAINDPESFEKWALRNPNDYRYLMNKWRPNHDVERLSIAIDNVRRRRAENPTADPVDIENARIDGNQQGVRRIANDMFERAVNAEPTTNAATIVRNKAIWKLQRDELARHIAPDEWQYVAEHLNGIIIEEGTTAIIYVDGQEVAQMGSGLYVFDDKHTIAAEIETQLREKEEQGFITRLRDNLYRFFTGNKRGESASERARRCRRVQDIMASLKRDTIIDVYLKTDRIFPAIFGSQHWSENKEGYSPYKIQSRNLDVYVGVSMHMQIGDFKEFITNYMPGYKTVKIFDVVKAADSAVHNILKYQLRNLEITERGLDEYTFNTIKNHLITNLPNILYGVKVVDILDIATTHKDLDRFRQVEERLYCSEREYDFLIRTNEFRNRVAAEENDQKIREVRSEQELRSELDNLNKDNLLQADEMESFVSLLMNQKAIREAINHADLDRAMTEIQRNRLVTDDEFEAFKEDLDNRRFERNEVSEQLRAKSLMATATTKLELHKMLTIANIQNTDAISEVEFDAFKKMKGREAEGWDLETMIYGRQYVYETQKLLSEQAIKRHQNAFEVEEAENANKVDAVNLEGNRQRAAFEREQMMEGHKLRHTMQQDNHDLDKTIKEDELELKTREADIELGKQERQMNIHLSHAERMAEVARKNMQAMQEIELQKKNIEADIEKTRIEAEKTMAADQLMAKNVASMDAAAQAKFAESFSHLNELHLTQQNANERELLYEQMLSLAKEQNISIKDIYTTNSKDQKELMSQVINALKDMNSSATTGQQDVLKSMVSAMNSVANARMNDAKETKEEYRTQMQHEQSRVDKNQEQSLNYTTRVKMSENMPFHNVAGTSVNVNVGKTRTCPVCGEPINFDGALCCPVCGADLK